MDVPDEFKLTDKQKLSDLSQRTINKVKKQIDKLRKQTLKLGDKVRVSTSTLNGEVRKNIKNGLSKLVVVKFSAKVFTVTKIVKSRTKKEFQLNRYEISDNKGNVLLDEYNINKPNKTLRPRRLNITDLLLVPEGTVNIMKKKDEEKLNKIVNVEYEPAEPVEVPINQPNIQPVQQVPPKSPIIRKSGRNRKIREIMDV